MQIIKKIRQKLIPLKIRNRWSFRQIYHKYKNYTMIPPDVYQNNLSLCYDYGYFEGDVVECGVWRGGMIAGMSEVLGNQRAYYLLDSFQGLPLVEAIDGTAAQEWQQNPTSPNFNNNCTAAVNYAEEAMKISKTANFHIIKGWFEDTLPTIQFQNPIAILRLDADWYKSTYTCLSYLYPLLAKEALIIVDDYYMWDGCSKAVHDYLSAQKLTDRIYITPQKVAYLIKRNV
jgi:O-methyltransferase